MSRAALATALLSLCILCSLPAVSEEVTRYGGLTELFNAEGEFTAEIGTLGPCSDQKLSCELRPAVDGGDSEEVRALRASQAVVKGVFLTFLRTDAERVAIKAVPQIFEGERWRLLPEHARRLAITREGAVAALRELIDIDDLTLLVADDVTSNYFDLVYVEGMEPGPERAFDVLEKHAAGQ